MKFKFLKRLDYNILLIDIWNSQIIINWIYLFLIVVQLNL